MAVTSRLEKRTSYRPSRLYLIVRGSTVFTSERHDDHLLEIWNCRQQQLRNTLHGIVRTVERKLFRRINRSRTCSPQLMHNDSTSSTGRSSSFSSFVWSERFLSSIAFVLSTTWPIPGKKLPGSDSAIVKCAEWTRHLDRVFAGDCNKVIAGWGRHASL